MFQFVFYYTANIFNVIFTLFTGVPLSTVIPLYCLHLITAPSTVENCKNCTDLQWFTVTSTLLHCTVYGKYTCTVQCTLFPCVPLSTVISLYIFAVQRRKVVNYHPISTTVVIQNQHVAEVDSLQQTTITALQNMYILMEIFSSKINVKK